MNNILGSEMYGPNIEDTLVNPSTDVLLETVFVCNTSNADTTFSIRIGKNNPAASIREYIYYNKTIEANDTLILNIYTTLNNGLKCYVKSTNGLVTFKAIGQ